jgi:hypothetical protein
MFLDLTSFLFVNMFAVGLKTNGYKGSEEEGY